VINIFKILFKNNVIYLSFPSISPVFFSIGPLDIRWYSLAYIVGFIFAWRYIKYLASNKAVSHSISINEKLIDDLIFYSIIGLIIGARLGYVIFYNYDYYSENLIEILYLWQGGLSFHGGLLGIVTAAIIISKLYKTTFFEISDLICVSAPVGIFFGRISNFINGELFGRPSNFLIGMKFPNADNQYRHPSQLYEAFLEGLLLFIILNFLIFKFKKLKNPGIISGVFLMLYGLFRFTVEFTREPDIQLGFVYHFFTMGMILSLPMFLAGILILVIKSNKNDTR
jgi:phosphatidylglycerol:prolipoprotein diacylglycerol transferase